MMKLTRRAVWIVLLLACLPLPAFAAEVTLHIDAGQTLRTFDHRALAGTNIAMWIGPDRYGSPTIQGWFRELSPGSIRMPGGSWSDIVFWNGNGMRGTDGRVDPTRVKDGYPAIDYSAYAPSIILDDKTLAPNAIWSGHIDVKGLHEFIRGVPNCETLVTVNAGTGRAEDAAEWVRWANLVQGYHVKYWEIGNELDGGWEAGHFLRGGGELTAEMYAKRFQEFARAMKAVDPTIKVGGATSGTDAGGFAETMLREVGDDVDFVSFHTYPCLPEQTEAEMLAATQTLQPAVARLRGWIEKYQPARAKQIPIALTEWNLAGSRLGSDLFSAMWSAIFLGEMARSGVDMAEQWDAFTQGPGEDGGALIVGDPPARKAQYWALWLWARNTGDTLVASEATPAQPNLYTLATRNKDTVYVMLANTSREEEVRAALDMEGLAPGAYGRETVLSLREYFWNPLARRVEWSNEPFVQPLQLMPKPKVIVPPFSLVFVQVPVAGSKAAEPAVSEWPISPPTEPEVQLVLPEEGYADTPVEGWVLARERGTGQPWPVALPAAKLEVTGPAQADRTTAPLAVPAGQFFLRPAGEGTATVTATVGKQTASAAVRFQPSVPRPYVFWQFGEGSLGKEKGVESDWPLVIDASARANQTVARVDLHGSVPEGNPTVLRLTSFPGRDKLTRENIRGVVFDLRLAPDLHSDDPNAHLDVVMQSTANWWVHVGGVPLLSEKGAWKTYSFPMTDPKHLRAMPEVFNLLLVLRSNKPVEGAVYLDRVGLLVR